MKILILGGYGVFGGRLAELLLDIPVLELLICGRDRARAKAFCAAHRGAARLVPLALDRKDIAAALQAERPDMVVDASGPFQQYGADGYRVIEACIAAKVDYLDFADGADFVLGVSHFNEAATAAGTFAISGVSSFPVLTAAVVRELAKEMEIVSVTGGIAPSPYAGIGLNVMRAVVGYAGSRVKLLRGGKSAFGTALGESIRYTIAVPGRLPLRNIHFSLVDVPDLQIIPPEHPGMQDLWMGAGPVPEVLHRTLNLLAKARAVFHLPSLVPLSKLFHRVLNLMKFGEHRGGMFVEARGLRGGWPVTQSWHLLAEADDGPYIPSMAVEAIVRKLLAGERPENGARPATRALELADYERLFESRTIYTGFRSEQPGATLYREILGEAFDKLPGLIQAVHDRLGTWTGQAEITRGRGLLARLVAAVVGFPKAGSAVPVEVTLVPEGGGERWVRSFAGKSFSSFQYAGTGRNDRLLVERFGLVSVALALVIDSGRLFLIPRRWSCVGIPLPHFLLPRGSCFESAEEGRFHFNVEIAAPLVGPIVTYRGTLAPR